MAATLTEAILTTTRDMGTGYALAGIPGAVAAVIYRYEGLAIDVATEIHYYGDIEYAEVSYEEDRDSAKRNRRTLARLLKREATADEIYQHLDDEWIAAVNLVRL